jgi:hypothetical protein
VIEVVTAAESKNLVTLAQLQGAPWYPGSTADAFLEEVVIPAASQAVVDHCRREFARQKYRETVSGFGSSSVTLSERPVEQILFCEVDGEEVDLDELTIEDAAGGEVARAGSAWAWRPRWTGRLEPIPMPYAEERNVDITYWAGYRIDAGSDGIALPTIVTLAAIATCQEIYGEMARDSSVTSRSITHPEAIGGSTSISYAANTAAQRRTGLPARALAWLRPYVRAA